jgi:c-di-GMP-binding flagellar brake protein YcgR
MQNGPTVARGWSTVTCRLPMNSTEPQVFSPTRRESRVRVDFAVRVTPLRTNEELLGISADLSSSGMAVYLPQDLCLGEHALLSFHVSNCPDLVTVEAVVRNKNAYRYGFEFVAEDVRKKKLDAVFQLTTTS